MSKKCVIETGGFTFEYKIDNTKETLDMSHCHSVYEIIYVLSGEGRYIVEGSSFDIKPGTLMVIRPFEYHSVLISDKSQYERYVIHFSESDLVPDALSLLEGFMSAENSSGKYYKAASLNGSVLSLLERFENALSIPKEERRVYVKMLLSELIVLLSVCSGEQMAHEEGELGARVIRYLNEHINKDVSLDKLAKRFFVSKYYLCRAFKKHNGISVHGYINQKRVMYAKQLIENGQTASGAAYQVGFGDYSAFYRAYVKIVGKSPTAE